MFETLAFPSFSLAFFNTLKLLYVFLTVKHCVPEHRQAATLQRNHPYDVHEWFSIFNNHWLTKQVKSLAQFLDLIQSISVIHFLLCFSIKYKPGHLAQSGARLTVNQGLTGSSPSPATFFCWDLVMKKFYDHPHPSADSRRAVVSYWQKYGH